MNTYQIGRLGEQLAAEYLRGKGYRLLGSRYRSRYGEIDLIAMDGEVLCFVEVKTRSNVRMGLPREYVTAAKQEKLRLTAGLYLAERGLECPVRFDVAEVYLDADSKGRIEYIENAF